MTEPSKPPCAETAPGHDRPDAASTRFCAALEQRDLAALRTVPKADLHNHAYLGGRRRYVEERSGRTVPIMPPIRSMAAFELWLENNIVPIFGTGESRRLAIESCFAAASEDGVSILEVGDDVLSLERHFGGAIEPLLDSFISAWKNFAPGIDFRFQVGLWRHIPAERSERLLEPFLDQRIVSAIDLYGDEAAQPIRNFKGIYRRAREQGWRLKAHAGEWGDAESVRDAVETLGLDEVQHGIAAAHSPEVMKWLATNGIRLNVCPTSNVALGRVPSLAAHPLRALFDHGVPVTVNSDDLLLFDQSVSEEFLALYEVGLFSPAELDLIRRRALRSRSAL